MSVAGRPAALLRGGVYSLSSAGRPATDRPSTAGWNHHCPEIVTLPAGSGAAAVNAYLPACVSYGVGYRAQQCHTLSRSLQKRERAAGGRGPAGRGRARTLGSALSHCGGRCRAWGARHSCLTTAAAEPGHPAPLQSRTSLTPVLVPHSPANSRVGGQYC